MWCYSKHVLIVRAEYASVSRRSTRQPCGPDVPRAGEISSGPREVWAHSSPLTCNSRAGPAGKLSHGLLRTCRRAPLLHNWSVCSTTFLLLLLQSCCLPILYIAFSKIYLNEDSNFVKIFFSYKSTLLVTGCTSPFDPESILKCV
jgi:hypothetical protein